MVQGLAVGDEVWYGFKCSCVIAIINVRLHFSPFLSIFMSISVRLSVEGYIMDQYCIDLGVLLDNQAIKTLENPGAHSLQW